MIYYCYTGYGTLKVKIRQQIRNTNHSRQKTLENISFANVFTGNRLYRKEVLDNNSIYIHD